MDYIEKLSSFTNVGRGRSREFLLNYFSRIENPQNKLKVIHITGTAGKGSTSAMIANGLKQSGYKVGLLTSPHLLNLNERIKINGKDISNERLNHYIEYFFNKVQGAMFSEYLTLIAIQYFLDENVDFVVCEVFIGGKSDPTNIFNSIATVITSIGLDHQNLLGNTKENILKDKLGIIRKDVPIFTRLENQIIYDEVKKFGAKYIKVQRREETNLLGEFQRENAGIAYEVLRYLGIDKKIISTSLQNVFWPGRLQYLGRNILIDSAHNKLGMGALRKYVDSLEVENIYYLFAMSKNKQFSDFSEYLDNAKEIVFTKPNMFKIENPTSYANLGKIIENPLTAYNHLISKLNENDLLVICGSIFLVSEILAITNQ